MAQLELVELILQGFGITLALAILFSFVMMGLGPQNRALVVLFSFVISMLGYMATVFIYNPIAEAPLLLILAIFIAVAALIVIYIFVNLHPPGPPGASI